LTALATLFVVLVQLAAEDVRAAGERIAATLRR
jgi:hypothetical protein